MCGFLGASGSLLAADRRDWQEWREWRKLIFSMRYRAVGTFSFSYFLGFSRHLCPSISAPWNSPRRFGHDARRSCPRLARPFRRRDSVSGAQGAAHAISPICLSRPRADERSPISHPLRSSARLGHRPERSVRIMPIQLTQRLLHELFAQFHFSPRFERFNRVQKLV